MGDLEKLRHLGEVVREATQDVARMTGKIAILRAENERLQTALSYERSRADEIDAHRMNLIVLLSRVLQAHDEQSDMQSLIDDIDAALAAGRE